MPSGFAIVMPARFGSSRFPGKPLALIRGRPLIEWVYRRAREVPGAARVVVATDHETIAEAIRRIGGEVIMTSPNCRTGTERVAEAAGTLGCDPIVNLQGDEPVFPPQLVSDMVELIRADPGIDIVTAAHPVFADEEMQNPNAVKVVTDAEGLALYFSRSPIPHRREALRSTAPESASPAAAPRGYRHIGIYVFRAASLFRFAELPPTRLELSEGLEQLRAIEHGMRIRVVKTPQPTVGVDVLDDVKKIEKALDGA
jgi:3-deoxy-manno-octulosonate cytidylyltransferase (CMP-KDO synthetase)